MADNWHDLDPTELGHAHLVVVIGCPADGPACTGGQDEPLALAITGTRGDQVPPEVSVAMLGHAVRALTYALDGARAQAADHAARRN